MAERKNGLWSDLVDLMIGLAFISGGVLLLQILGFTAVHYTSNWRDSHSSAVGSPTWWESFQQMGIGHPGTIFYLSLPCIAILYGSYYFASAVKRIHVNRGKR